ncbi:unnamed protein product [Owenia fusiformis]|uniref:Uncharacterized protein n=1 Tax=Owenia fusiformis TaxID=6347 RepID=A0A8S4PXM3_OWEFU|nr:unnamed protein product [Owenia fusiformis]
MIVTNILIKFKKKIKAAMADINSPAVHDYAWESGAKFWCYFCAKEIEKHQRQDEVAIKNAGLLEHLTSTDHDTFTNDFWRKHKIEGTNKNIYILPKDKLKRFLENTEGKKREYTKKKEDAINKEVKRIQQMEARRQFYKRESKQATIVDSTNQGETKADNQRSHGMADQATEKLGGVRTASVHAEGLTNIGPQLKADSEGNIFTGATPPWLLGNDRSAESGSRGNTIGPTLDDFQQHLHKEQKKKLPSTRVGANFDHATTSDQQWLPSFGGVWTHGKRSDTKQHFLQKYAKSSKRSPSAAIGSAEQAETGTESVDTTVLKPYIRKRPKLEVQSETTSSHLSYSHNSQQNLNRTRDSTSADFVQSQYEAHGNQYGTRGNQYETHGTQYETHGTQYETHGNQYETHGYQYETHGNQYETHGNQYETHGNQYGTHGNQYGTYGNWTHTTQFGPNITQHASNPTQYGSDSLFPKHRPQVPSNPKSMGFHGKTSTDAYNRGSNTHNTYQSSSISNKLTKKLDTYRDIEFANTKQRNPQERFHKKPHGFLEKSQKFSITSEKLHKGTTHGELKPYTRKKK